MRRGQPAPRGHRGRNQATPILSQPVSGRAAPAGSNGPGVLSASGGRGGDHRIRSPAKLWPLWLFLGLTPFFALLLVEGILRAVGYGYPTSLVRLTHLAPGARAVLTGNPDFGRQFFPDSRFRSLPSFVLEAQKGPSTRRVFILGSSAAMGDPEPAFSLARMLEVMLAERFPEHRFEVVNAAMAAINSHAALVIGKEALRLQADALVLLEGNNEVIGPFGPGTSDRRGLLPLTWIRASLALRRTRIGQWAASWHHSDPERDPGQWAGLAQFAQHRIDPQDPRLEQVARHLESNVSDLARRAQRQAVPLLVLTVPVCLADFPPFASGLPQALDPSDRATLESSLQAAAEALRSGRPLEAAQWAETAWELAPDHAGARYARGMALRALGRPEAARALLQGAVDHDLLKLRTDSLLNQALRRAAGSAGATLVEVELAFQRDHPGGAGRESFLEHVHFTFEGTYRMAAEVWPALCAALWPTREESSLPPPLSALECRLALGYNIWEEALILQQMAERLSRPPFLSQPENSLREAAFAQRARTLHASSRDPRSAEAMLSLYRAASARRPSDWVLQRNQAQFLLALKRRSEALELARSGLSLHPEEPSLLEILIASLIGLERLEEAESNLTLLARDRRATTPVERFRLQIATAREASQRARNLPSPSQLDRVPGSHP